ncbi:MAG: endonuclease III [Gammaproteobacteria bacterium]|nr:endonuclease III [Gammaproteobacteria bacterium]
MNAAHRAELFARLQRTNPKPTTELEYDSPYELLVAVILSAQATDKSVNLATAELFKTVKTPAQMVELGVRGLKRYIKSIGLFNTKAANILQTSKMLVEKYNGEVPHTREELEALAGVGRKTANVVLNTAFGEPTIAVDTHIFRVANRTGLAPGRNVREVEDKLMQAVPRQYRHDAHHWLILHGRYICVARTPRCFSCPIHDLCEYPDKTPVPLATSSTAAKPAGKKTNRRHPTA